MWRWSFADPRPTRPWPLLSSRLRARGDRGRAVARGRQGRSESGVKERQRRGGFPLTPLPPGRPGRGRSRTKRARPMHAAPWVACDDRCVRAATERDSTVKSQGQQQGWGVWRGGGPRQGQDRDRDGDGRQQSGPYPSHTAPTTPLPNSQPGA